MGDRVSQLQELLHMLMQHYRNAVGVIHTQAGEAAQEILQPASKQDQGKAQGQGDQHPKQDVSARQQVKNTVGATKQAILQTIKDVDFFCDHLPDIKQASESSTADLEELQRRNSDAAELLRDKVKLAEAKLAALRARITEITDATFLTTALDKTADQQQQQQTATGEAQQQARDDAKQQQQPEPEPEPEPTTTLDNNAALKKDGNQDRDDTLDNGEAVRKRAKLEA